ncbi:uncharacterized protein LOC144564755 [Carex rostrata]
MAETEDSISNKPTMQHSSNGKKQTHKKRDKALSWRSSLDFFSTCKDCEASLTKKNRNKIKKSKKGKNGGDLETSPCNSIPSRSTCVNSICVNSIPSRAISASSSFNSVTTACSSFSSLSSISSRSFSSLGGSFRGMQIRTLSGCSEYNAVAGPLNWVPSPSLRASLHPCNACGEIFTKAESLEMHQATQHAVSELGPEDTSRKIVEIIFQSSWLQKQSPVCKIERILKIHNTKSTVSKFEEYRESIKLKSFDQGKRNPRCMADGNELLRFFGTTFECNLGLDSTSHLCRSMNKCSACSIIKDGFKLDVHGKICTVATSGRAHVMVRDPLVSEGEKKAMLVCRVVAGRVKGNCDDVAEFDSLTSSEGHLDDLSVFNPRAILPCFVVIYSGY